MIAFFSTTNNFFYFFEPVFFYKFLPTVFLFTFSYYKNNFLYFTFFKEKLQKLIRPTKGWQLGTGAASGVMGGLFAMHGPPVVLYLISSEPDKDHYMGMIQTYAVITNISMLAVRAFNGYVTQVVGMTYLYALAGLAAGVR